jgi:hypothetical protein
MVFMFGVTFVCEYEKQRWSLHVSFLHSFCLHSFTLYYICRHFEEFDLLLIWKNGVTRRYLHCLSWPVLKLGLLTDVETQILWQ